MTQPRLVLVLVCAAIHACAPYLDASNGEAYRSFWEYVPGASAAPIATYGEPNTATQMSLECVPSEQALRIEIVDTEITQDRLVELRVADATFRGVERLQPSDGFAISHITVPWQEPLLARYAAGAGSIKVIATGERFKIPDGEVPQRMVQDCLRLRS